jgi:hypothetical protein
MTGCSACEMESIFEEIKIVYGPKIKSAIGLSKEQSQISSFLVTYGGDLKKRFEDYKSLNDIKRFSDDNLNKHMAFEVFEALGRERVLGNCDMETVNLWKNAFLERKVPEGVIDYALKQGIREGEVSNSYA